MSFTAIPIIWFAIFD